MEYTKKGKLYLIPSELAPNTNLNVLPTHIIEIVSDLTFYLVENERTTRRFISSLKLGIDIDKLHFTILDKDTMEDTVKPVLKLIIQGNNVGVVSEAGCPGIADPGALAVRLAHKMSIEVVALVGPCSILLALMSSGFSGQSFVFHGYLPIEKTERVNAIKQLEKDANGKKQTQIFIETPFRNNAMYAAILSSCNPNTLLCIACDLTAATQFAKTHTIFEWKKQIIDLNKRPTVFLIG